MAPFSTGPPGSGSGPGPGPAMRWLWRRADAPVEKKVPDSTTTQIGDWFKKVFTDMFRKIVDSKTNLTIFISIMVFLAAVVLFLIFRCCRRRHLEKKEVAREKQQETQFMAAVTGRGIQPRWFDRHAYWPRQTPRQPPRPQPEPKPQPECIEVWEIDSDGNTRPLPANEQSAYLQQHIQQRRGQQQMPGPLPPAGRKRQYLPPPPYSRYPAQAMQTMPPGSQQYHPPMGMPPQYKPSNTPPQAPAGMAATVVNAATMAAGFMASLWNKGSTSSEASEKGDPPAKPQAGWFGWGSNTTSPSDPSKRQMLQQAGYQPSSFESVQAYGNQDGQADRQQNLAPGPSRAATPPPAYSVASGMVPSPYPRGYQSRPQSPPPPGCSPRSRSRPQSPPPPLPPPPPAAMWNPTSRSQSPPPPRSMSRPRARSQSPAPAGRANTNDDPYSIPVGQPGAPTEPVKPISNPYTLNR